MKSLRAIALAPLLVLVACGGEAPPPAAPVHSSPTAKPVASAAPATQDPLGARPTPGMAPPFVPPTPIVFKATNGITVWLVERHTLPIVAVTVAIPAGSAADPVDRGGVAFQTANMLDEGAGKYDALGLARAVDGLGADLHTSANTDFSSASLVLLKRNLAAGLPLLGDVVARPKFAATEWARQSTLWQNDLKARASDPQAVAHVLFRTAVYGPGHPYGHPVDGTTTSAKKVGLADVKAYYAKEWRPDRAVVIVVGDTTKAELEPMLDAAFGAWKAPKSAPPEPVKPLPRKPTGNRVYLVDRADAPQSVIAIANMTVDAADPASPLLSRVNIAFGGSFTSRLNQDLREEHGWSYGAFSRALRSRGPGELIASSSVVTEKSADALRAMIKDMKTFSTGGLTDDEVKKTQSQSRADLVGDYEQVEKISALLSSDAAMGLPPDYQAKGSVARDQMTKEQMNQIAKSFYDPSEGVVIAVGPKATLITAIQGA
ncbi:MAG: insulinase family protein, partial [Polyangiaceae bacterium]